MFRLISPGHGLHPMRLRLRIRLLRPRSSHALHRHGEPFAHQHGSQMAIPLRARRHPWTKLRKDCRDHDDYQATFAIYDGESLALDHQRRAECRKHRLTHFELFAVYPYRDVLD